MKFIIEHKIEGFEGIKFEMDLVSASKTVTNTSYPNLSNCCQKPLKQIKVCGECEKEADKNCEYKQFKLSKDKSYPISTAQLEVIKKSMDTNRITITQFRDRNDIDDHLLTDKLQIGQQSKSYTKEYVEYRDILRKAGKIAIGYFIMRNRPYPVMICADDQYLTIHPLHFADEINLRKEIESVSVNTEKVELYSKLAGIKSQKEAFQINDYVNDRKAKEEELIEKVIKGEKLPSIEEIKPIEMSDDTAEIERLKELLAQQEVAVA
ncbi:Ku protein [Planctomycetota bacterium]